MRRSLPVTPRAASPPCSPQSCCLRSCVALAGTCRPLAAPILPLVRVPYLVPSCLSSHLEQNPSSFIPGLPSSLASPSACTPTCSLPSNRLLGPLALLLSLSLETGLRLGLCSVAVSPGKFSGLLLLLPRLAQGRPPNPQPDSRLYTGLGRFGPQRHLERLTPMPGP